MSQHEDLLEQAIHLATIDAKKPKQVNLRRAISFPPRSASLQTRLSIFRIIGTWRTTT